MALNAVELKLLVALVARIKKNGRTPRILFLGYPDALVDRANWNVPDLPWEVLPKRLDAAKVWEQHSRPHMRDQQMLDTRALFQRIEAEVTVSDAIAWGDEDAAIDLNKSVPRRYRKAFDLIVDPGTLEHCFNIARAFENVDAMLKPGGFAYHQAASAFPNHGFWSISPTAFFDFYEPLGYELGQPYQSMGAVNGNSDLNPYVEAINPFRPRPEQAGPAVVYYLFRKRTAQRRWFWRRQEYPLQRCYSSRSSTPPMTDFMAVECQTAAARLPPLV